MNSERNGIVTPERLLSDLRRRPTPNNVSQFSEAEIIRAVNEIGYDHHEETIGRVSKVHELVLPVLESGLTKMLTAEEGRNPDYYAFARDAEIIYDALWGIAQAGQDELSERVHYLKTSLVMRYSQVKPDSQYFKSIGINQDRIKSGNSFVFIDSGFRGSLFHAVADWAGIEKDLNPLTNFHGYLASCSSNNFSGLDFSSALPEVEKELRSALSESPYAAYAETAYKDLICAFMQLMPKHTGRYVVTRKKDGVWDAFPERNEGLSKLNKKIMNSDVDLCPWTEQRNGVTTKCYSINDDVLDPVASMLLQRRTLEYFSDPNVHDRVYNSIKGRNIKFAPYEV